MKRFAILSVLALLCGAALPVAADDVPGVRLPCEPALVGTVTDTACLFGGIYGTYQSPSAPVLFDIGSPHRITGISFMAARPNWSMESMKKTLTYEASLDGVTYEKIFENNNREFATGGDYTTYAVDDDHHGPYRYFRVYVKNGSNAYTWFQITDIRVVSEDLSIDGIAPEVWADRSAVSQPGTNEVTFAAKILSAPGGTATAYAAYAKKDLGRSLSEWRTKGAVVELGSGAAGETVSGSAADIPPGNYIVRYFATSGDDEYVWPLHCDMTIDSSAYPGTMYTLSSANFKNVYNANVDNGDSSAFKTPDGHSVIFSLADIPADEVVGSLRLWSNIGYRQRAFGLPVEVSFDEVDLETDSTEEQVVGDRVVRKRESFPEMNWETVGVFSNAAATISYLRDTSGLPEASTQEIVLDPATMRRRPTYLRVPAKSDGSPLYLLELELRATKLPAYPEGEAQIDEIGPAFARVSGRIDYAGLVGGNATLYLAATPKAGGATVSSVVATGVAEGGTFAGIATGLAGETEYGWQVIASNATAGAAIAHGTFTTLPSSGSLVPIVEMTGATAQADGSVLIGYSLSEAGEGYALADVYVRYGTDPNDLSNEKLIASGVVGAGSVAVEGLPPGVTLYLALVAKNAGGAVSEPTDRRSCETVGPCGLVGVAVRPAETGCGVTITGTLEPRGVGPAEIYFDYVTDALGDPSSVLAGTIPFGASSNFTVTAALPRLNCVTGVVRVVNAFGGVTWTNRTGELTAPLGVRMPSNPTVVGTASDTSRLYCRIPTDQWRSQNAPYVFDIGAPRLVSGVSFMANKLWWGYSDMLNTLRFEGSLDGVTYETMFVNAGRPIVKGGVYMNYVAENGHYGPYRYIRVSIPTGPYSYAGLQLCDVSVLSTGLVVEGNPPAYWNLDLEAEQTDRVTFSGCLRSAPAGSAHVYAACSPRDLGDNLADWQAKGEVVDLGVVNEGEFFTNVASVAAGAYYCRYYAVSGDDVHFSPELHTFSADSVSFAPSKIYISGDAAASVKSVYNGVLNSYAWYNATMPQMVLPLGEIPAGYRLASVRVWIRGGYSGYLTAVSADVSYDAADLDAVSSEVQTMNNRTVMGVSAFPEMTWTEAGTFTCMGDVIDHTRNTARLGVEINLSRALCDRHPTFIRINHNLSTLAIDEIELRVTAIPPEPEGGAQIDEVGSAFARTSGHVNSVGSGGGNCTVYFAATPTAGGKDVSAVLATDIGDEQDFEGTAVGLRSSTEYDWQIVASNETAGTVIAAGTFTTQQGSGSLVPIVEMTGATANDDGTVTVGYNLSDAGEGYALADVYVRYGTTPDDLSGEVLAVQGVVGENAVAVSGLPLGQFLYLALVAKNEGGAVSEVTEPMSCTTVGPCGLTGVDFRPEGLSVTVMGTLSPRGLGEAQVYLDYGSASGELTTSVLAGTVAADADASFSFDVVLPRQESVFCRLRVENAFGGGSWTVSSDEVRVPLGVRLPSEPVRVGKAYDTSRLYNRIYTAAYRSNMPYVFDIGGPRLISGVSFMVNALNWSYSGMLKSLTFEASADGVTYEPVFVNASRAFTKGGVYMSYAVDDAHRGPYRYIRVSIPESPNKYDYLQLCDMCVLSPGLVVEGDRPQFWNRDLEAAPTNVGSFSGRLLSAPAGSAHVYAVCATRDLGDDLSDWQASGTIVDLGIVDEGEAFAGEGTVPTGAYFCRYYAVSGEDVHFSPQLFTFTSGTESFVPSKLYISADATGGNGVLRIYNGVLNSYAFYKDTTPQIVLPLDEIPAGYRLASVRVWVRPGNPQYLYDISADVSDDAVDLDAVSTEVQTMNNRTMMGVSAFPSMTWTEVGAFTRMSDVIDLGRSTGRDGVEFLLSPSLTTVQPKFMRINSNTTTLAFDEIELRVTPIPAAPEGRARIDELGAAFARVSGHLYFTGTGGETGTIRFEATPTAGGDTAVSVVATDVGAEGDFAGTATGLRGSTEYDWQMIAANATAEAVIASGTFTTAPSSGSVVPVISFTAATAQEDGTVLIGYNLSDAGEGYATADLYVRYGTNPDDLSDELLVAQGVVGEDVVTVAGLPPGQSLHLALVAKNEGGAVSEVTESKPCETAGPGGIAEVSVRPADTGCGVTVSGMLSPRGAGDAQVYLDYVSDALSSTTTVLAGSVASTDPSNFTFTVALPRYNCISGSVRVVNAFGGVAWTNVTDEMVAPLGVRMPLEAPLVGSAATSYQLWDGNYKAPYQSATTPYVFDIGAPRLISGVSFMVNALNWSPEEMKKTLTIEASADGVSYEAVFRNDNREFTKGVYMSYAVDGDHHGPYRYFRISTKLYSGAYWTLQLCDTRVLSTGLAVEGKRPEFWNHGLEEVPTSDVTFSGRLLSAPSGSAHVYAVYSKYRLGDSAETWLARGMRVDLGTVNEGESFSVTTSVPSGAYFCRYCAVSGSDVHLAAGCFTFSSETTSFVPSKIYVSGDAAASLVPIYDGDTSSFVWYSDAKPEIVLPLDELPEGNRLASVRVRTRYQNALYDVSADVSFDDVKLDDVSTEVQTKNNRTTMGVSAFPEMTWTPAGAVTQMSDVIDLVHSAFNSVEFNISRALSVRHPKFLRIRYPEGTCSFAEIELRSIREPGFSVIVK